MHAKGIVRTIVIVLIIVAIAGAWWVRSGGKPPWDKQ